MPSRTRIGMPGPFAISAQKISETIPSIVGRGRRRVAGRGKRDGERIKRARADIAEHDANGGEREEDGAALVQLATGGSYPRWREGGALGMHNSVSLPKVETRPRVRRPSLSTLQ